jgi:hypothetical protein
MLFIHVLDAAYSRQAKVITCTVLRCVESVQYIPGFAGSSPPLLAAPVVTLKETTLAVKRDISLLKQNLWTPDW